MPGREGDLFEAWRAYMRAGAFEKAWRISDQVLAERRGARCDHLPLHQRWLWDGRSVIDRPVLICCYHGLGDTIQFIRYAPLVRELARRVEVVVQPELQALARTVRGIDCVTADRLPAESRPGLIQVEIMELPHLFRTTLGNLPNAVPYFHVKPAALARAAGTRNIGLVWRAGNGWDCRRTIPAAALAPLARLSRLGGIRIHILQLCEQSSIPDGLGVMAQRDTIFDLARLMRALDLVITVDSMPAHLAGALAVPVWTLLHADADWRWMSDRLDSPWYPTMRLFRQRREGEWDWVIEQVADELRAFSPLRGPGAADGDHEKNSWRRVIGYGPRGSSSRSGRESRQGRRPATGKRARSR